MITPDQLTTITTRYEYLKSHNSQAHHFCIVDYGVLLAEITRLQAALTTKDSVLSQFANSANWVVTPPAEDESFYDFSYVGSGNPIHIANQALSEGKE